MYNNLNKKFENQTNFNKNSLTNKVIFCINKKQYKRGIIMKVAIVTDSNSGITPKEAKELGITVVPMPFLIDGEEYFEEIDLSQEQFYEKLLNGADVSTSQPSISNVVEIWKNLLKNYDEVVHIPMSSALSASCETATSFAKEFGGKVEVVDNKRISVTQKQATFDALKLAKEGLNAKEIKEKLLQSSKNSSIYIMLSTLKYLKKGGRITPAAALLGRVLGIKPVLKIQGEKLDKFAQVLSFSLGRRKMIEQITKEITTRFKDIYEQNRLEVMVAYTYDKNKALEFKNEIEKAFAKFNLKVSFVDPLSLSVACHIGENAIAIAVAEKL